MTLQVLHILETCLYVDDLEAAERFYCEILGLKSHSRLPERHVFLRCEPGMLLLFRAEHTRTVSTDSNGALVPSHGTTGAGHLVFAVLENALPDWRDFLTNKNISIESERQWPNGGRSLYFRDPSGNLVEIATAGIWRS